MSTIQTSFRKLTPLWLSAWPLLALASFGFAAAARWLPGGYARAVVAAPIIVMVPGSLTLGAIFGVGARPRPAAFLCYSALLGVIWFSCASLVLYALGVLLTTDSMYLCLLAICAALAIVAQARLRGRQPAVTSAAADNRESPNPDRPRPRVLAAPFYAAVAVAAGLSLLAGAVFVQGRFSNLASAGFTWMAWEHPHGTGEYAVGSAGAQLRFEIVHRQARPATFRLSAAWQGGPPGSLAKPLALRLDPNQTFHAALFVPPLPRGCTYRVVITLSSISQADPLTGRTQSWSINAGVHGQGKPQRMCK